MSHSRAAILALLGFAVAGTLTGLGGLGRHPQAAQAAGPAQHPTGADPMLGMIFTPPPTVYPPSQADQGAQVYFYICEVCHGDRGQGLTIWRATVGPPENNCCHGPHLGPNSFHFPENVPPVIGPGVLEGFGTALNLHNFLKSQMPYYAPGDLTDEQYWQLTAFLIRANGRDPGSQPLDEARAAKISFVDSQQPLVPLWVWIAGGGVVLVMVMVAIYIRRERHGI